MTPWWKEPTGAQWVTFLASWLGWVLDAFDFTIFLLVMPEIAKEFGVTHTATAGSITLTLLVRLAGGYVAGQAADRFGRKLPLMLSVVWFAACDGAIAFAGSFTTVLVLRTLFGFGMGAEWTAGTTLAMESWPERSRGIASGMLQTGWAVGYLLAGVVSAWVVPALGWRALFVIAAVPALLVLPIRFWVPESQEWLTRAKGRATEVTRGPAFTGPIIGRILWGSLVIGLGFAAYYGMTGLYPTMLKTELMLSTEDVGPIVVVFNVGMMFGTVASGLLAAKKNVTWSIAAPALLVLLALPFYVGAIPGYLFMGAFFAGALGAGYSGTTPLLLTSLFPAEVRARAVGIVYHAGAFMAAFVPMGIAAFSERSGRPLSVCILGAVAVFDFLLAVVLLVSRPERLRVKAAPAPTS